MSNQGSMTTYRRSSVLQQLANEELDLLVIGGGITGAGIALDAADRGLKVGLVEKQDFGAGTSSRSTKLIHGGLRYLKQGEIKLVQEVGRERAILYRNAPHIVIPEKMLLPLVENGTYGKWATSIGLWIYDRLAGVVKEERRVMLNKAETLELEPLLRKDILKGGGLYIEYRTDDARLTIEVIKTAHAYGALCANYAEATEFVYNDRHLVGVHVTDLLTQQRYTLRVKKIVNAAGPWVDRLREKDASLYGKRLHLTKGVHLVVPRKRFPLRQATYFDVADGRMIFAIPRGEVAYIGTTDTDYQGDSEHPRVTREDVDYLLSAVNHMFPTVRLSEADIHSSWAGLRPLIHEDGKSPSELSRKDEIILSPSGLITIAGGKLTGYRKMAERVVDLVARQIGQEEGRTFKPCATDRIVLSGGNFQSPRAIPDFIRKQSVAFSDLAVTERQIADLTGKYGTNSEKILQRAKEMKQAGIDGTPKQLLLKAELQYGVKEEMVVSVNDFLIRRTGKMFFERDTLDTLEGDILEELARILDWNEDSKQLYREQTESEYQATVRFV